MEPITYSLKANQINSDEYYKEIKSFTDEILKEFERFDTPIIDDYIFYSNENYLKKQQKNEYIFELLMIGILWKVYNKKAYNLDEKPQKLLESLVSIRNENKYSKEKIDIIRGILMTTYLLPEKQDEYCKDLTFNNFNKLLMYMRATGDFKQEIRKLNSWKEFLKTRSREEVSRVLEVAVTFAEIFEIKSQSVLGKYTVNIEKYLDEKYYDYLWTEDIIFCGRREVEYHLNMVGAEIMNRSFKIAFDKRHKKALILPGCMRSSNENCKAKETNLGLKCIKCTKSCNINQLTDMGKEYKFEVYIVKHESSAFSKSTRKDRDELGIIGVSCILNLIAGGWKSESLNIPAQCVLLEQSTCKNHWHKEGFPSDINLDQLIKMLGFKEISTDIKPQNSCGSKSC
jgi:hypothetical protein